MNQKQNGGIKVKETTSEKMIIIGDIHAGVRNNSTKYLGFQEKWFKEELFPAIKNNNCKHVIFLGDIFDSRNSLSPIILQKVRELFKELISLGVQCYVVMGNHDIFYRNNKTVHSLDILTDQGVIVYDNPTQVTIENKNILMLPWIVKDEIEDVKKLLVNDNYDLCFGHLEINNFDKVKGVTEKEGLPTELFANCKKVFSGHFHLKRNSGNIQYTGTPYELTWNDYEDQKGIYLLDLETLDADFIPTKNTPKHIKISNKSHTIGDIKSEIITNNIIRVTFDENISEANKIDFIEKINSLEPIVCTVEDEIFGNFNSDEDIETDIKDTLGFLQEYIEIIELPEEFSKKILFEKIQEIYNKCL